MERTLITVTEYCSYHHIEPDFVYSLADGGLLEIIIEQEQRCIPFAQLIQLERLSRLHYDLDINMEGLAAISHLLQKVNLMQDEMNELRNELFFHRQGGRVG